ncbi:MAG: CvpA family protein [Planctomycetaceae bacterium]|nr:CvpA family protein [Planctomycetaceae bacterium]
MLAPYDIVMLAVLAGTLLWGLWKGMAWQAASLCSVVLSGAVAIHSSPSVAPWFGQQEPWNRFFAMLVLYVVTAGAIWISFRLVSGVLDRVQLKEFDRQLGGLFGLAKGALYCILITFFAVTLSEPSRQSVLESRSGDLIARGIRNANPILPEDVRAVLGKYIDELDQKLHAPPVESTTPTPAPSATPAATPPSVPASQPAPPPVRSRGEGKAS